MHAFTAVYHLLSVTDKCLGGLFAQRCINFILSVQPKLFAWILNCSYLLMIAHLSISLWDRLTGILACVCKFVTLRDDWWICKSRLRWLRQPYVVKACDIYNAMQWRSKVILRPVTIKLGSLKDFRLSSSFWRHAQEWCKALAWHVLSLWRLWCSLAATLTSKRCWPWAWRNLQPNIRPLLTNRS